MHSYTEHDPEFVKAMEESMAEQARKRYEQIESYRNRVAAENGGQPDPQLGPTGRFPEGQLTPNDQGEFAFRIAVVNGAVVFDFGSPVRSLGFTPQQALELSDLLRQRARQLLPAKQHNHGRKGK